MPWKVPQPVSQWSDKDRVDFFREIWSRLKFGAFIWAPPAIGAGVATTFVVAASGGSVDSLAPVGLRVGQPVTVTVPGLLPFGLTVSALVRVADQLTITIANSTGAPIAPPAGLWSFQGTVL